MPPSHFAPLALVAYWGTAEAPACFRVRVLHDGHDFSDAQFFSIQRGGDVLGGINFATDGGDKHPSLDRLKSATIAAKDLRVRFEFGGAAAAIKPVAPASVAETARFEPGNLHLEISVPYAAFALLPPHSESGMDATHSWFDLVLYSGEEKTFKLAELNEAAVGFAIRLTTAAAPMTAVNAQIRGGNLEMQWQSLRLQMPVHPAASDLLQKSAVSGF